MPPKKRSVLSGRVSPTSANKAANQSSSPQTSSSNSGSKKAKKDQFTCPICEEVIVDASGKKQGQDSIECDGNCATWIHRRCAGLSKVSFNSICKSDNPFYCPQCRLDKHELEINSLRDMVVNLSGQLSIAKDELADMRKLVQTLSADPICSPGFKSYASVISNSAEPQTFTTKVTQPVLHQPLNRMTQNQVISLANQDRKFNIVIFGIEECPTGTPKHARVQKDLDAVVCILNEIDQLITHQSLRDARRLGKYKESNHRPILVQFTRVSDVTLILSQRSKLSNFPSISIKADLTRSERAIESLLLKERRSLITSGIDRKLIKIRGNSIFVNNKRHGKATESTFDLCTSSENTSAPIITSNHANPASTPSSSPTNGSNPVSTPPSPQFSLTEDESCTLSSQLDSSQLS